MNLEELKYPIGRRQQKERYSILERTELITAIAGLPDKLEKAVAGLSAAQLATSYRPEGWTLAQVVHHLADSHMNSFIRFKLTLTEAQPQVKTFDENLWAAMPDAGDTDVRASLHILGGIHFRWERMLNNMQETDFDRTFYHPEQQRLIRLDEILGLYGWHGAHHLAQITETIRRNNW